MILADHKDGTEVGTGMLHPVMWMFVAILVTFVITRLITRMIRSGRSGPARDLSIGGVHLHHQVFGILIMIGAGIGLVANTPVGAALNIVAAVFGVGVSLTLDEFALWFHLEDVYWSDQGRQSVDAIFCVLAVSGVLIGGADFVTGRPGTSDWWGSIGLLALAIALALICMLKGKFITGFVGVLLIPLALVGAIRLAKPSSWWARRRYEQSPKRAARAAARFGPQYDARWNRLRDLVAGAPDANR